jgi:predicted nucleic acid-binding protein
MRPRESEGTQSFLEGLERYDVDWELARYAGLLKNEWARKGQTLSVPDVLIAATALSYSLVLMTDNRKDFPMPQLTLYPLP